MIEREPKAEAYVVEAQLRGNGDLIQRFLVAAGRPEEGTTFGQRYLLPALEKRNHLA